MNLDCITPAFYIPRLSKRINHVTKAMDKRLVISNIYEIRLSPPNLGIDNIVGQKDLKRWILFCHRTFRHDADGVRRRARGTAIYSFRHSVQSSVGR